MGRMQVMIVDDHAMMRRGLRELLNDEGDFEICAEAADIADALDCVRDRKPHLALVDVSLPSGSGLELAKQMLAMHPKLRILFISMHDDMVFAERALRAGALGFINKARSGEEMLAAIRKVSRGEIALGQPIADRLIQRGVGVKNAPPKGVESLSDRELEVFELIGRGMGTREIAERLCLSVKTVESHREHIKTKLKVKNATDLSHQATLWCGSAGRGDS